jgi:hypothetical protein
MGLHVDALAQALPPALTNDVTFPPPPSRPKGPLLCSYECNVTYTRVCSLLSGACTTPAPQRSGFRVMPPTTAPGHARRTGGHAKCGPVSGEKSAPRHGFPLAALAACGASAPQKLTTRS